MTSARIRLLFIGGIADLPGIDEKRAAVCSVTG